ncbi:hypothetical protein GCM10007063_31820 [Lentibacillus kapialis]|uniref:Uncharacterized protein n=1 Tax=Lentibacillus kapialis TaxID=340214 RepID=A0A917Q219_9BACI|nr:hypothetical protein [Lentibacillus kapialis]GGK06899.1 hypothetical protein GCM10007063_31820 [Lentibacillus kapialis]
MEKLSYKAFMNDVRQRLAYCSEEELRHLIMEWAAAELPDKRLDFLNKLKPDSQEAMPETDADALMDDIEVFARNVEDGAYVDGYGWDDNYMEERDFGDESWAWEMDDFFVEARHLLKESHHEAAEKAYRKLFAVLEMGEEPGHLPGDVFIENMLEIDLQEHVALFLRSVYINAKSGERVNLLYEAMKEFSYLTSPNVKLTDINDSLDASLPDFHDFLTGWIEFLKEKPIPHVNALLREAVFLKGGIPAIAEFARGYANKFPEAYMDWIAALEKEGDRESILQVVTEGLDNIPGTFTVRANIAEKMTEIGNVRRDNRMALKGLRESFHSNPSMNYLLDLYMLAEEENCLDDVRDEAEKRMNDLRNAGSATRGFTDRRHAAIDEGDYIHALILGGRYETVFEMCQGKGALGWSFSDHPKPVMLTFLMDVLSKGDDYSHVRNDQWRYAISRMSFGTPDIDMAKYHHIINRVKDNVRLTDEQEEFYLTWCQNETGRRIDAIVSNKYRGSYDKAAKVLVAMAETLADRGSEQDGHAFVETHRSKYSRYSAFRREIAKALQNSGL